MLEFYRHQAKSFKRICLLQPTSQLCAKKDIQGVYAEFDELIAKAVVSVCEVEHSPAICNVLSESKDINGFISTAANKRHQEIEKILEN